MKCTDIGYTSGNDRFWVILDGQLISEFAAVDPLNILGNLADCWHGRYDHLSWKCSIVPSEECRELTEPPDTLIEKLRERFNPVSAFYYYGHNQEDVEPLECSDAE